MAYISPEDVKVIRNNIKKAFPAKDGWKFSVTNEDYSLVKVAIMKAPTEYGFDGFEGINRHQIESKYKDQPKSKEMLIKLYGIIAEKHWDESDSMTDYFHCSFYITMSIGKWDKDCVMSEKK